MHFDVPLMYCARHDANNVKERPIAGERLHDKNSDIVKSGVKFYF